MDAFSEVAKWLTDAGHWSGPDGIPVRVLQHVGISLASILVAILIAVPAGLMVGHTRRGELLAVSIANIGRAVPSFALLVLAFVFMLRFLPSVAFGNGPGLVALTLLAIPPILTNTYVGVQGIDQDTVEAARGMGMRGTEILRRLEIPLSAPLIMAGIRTAAVTVVATASLVALVAGGTLGRYIVDGLARDDDGRLIAGALLIALLAILTEVGLALLQRAITPRTASRGQPHVEPLAPRG